MRTKTSIFFILLFSASLAGLTACNNEPQQKEPDRQVSDRNGLDFVESSAGLPNSGKWRHGICFYDMNRDGNLDILAPPPRLGPESDRKPFVWLGNGKGEWSSLALDVPGNIPYDYGDIAAADFNGDGIPDMALAIHTVGLRGLRGAGKGKFSDFSIGLPSDFSSRALVAADFNNDGIVDIAAVSEGNFGKMKPAPRKGITVCLGSSTGWKCRPVGEKIEMMNTLYADRIITGDVNGDGNADLGIASLQHMADYIVWLGDGKGDFAPFNHGLPTELHYPSVAFGDFDGDGRDDLIASMTGFGKDGIEALKVFLSREDSFKEMSKGLPEHGVFKAVSAGDLNGDSVPEIVGGTSQGRVKVFSLKDGVWKEITTSGLPDIPLDRIYNTYCVDVNHDGVKDIIFNYASRNGAGGIRVFLTVPR